jgi:hypothetical protein
MEAASPRKDFFISYTSADLAWAKWIAEVLESKGFTTVYQHRDFPAAPTDPSRDPNFIRKMHEALEAARCTLALLSPDYLKSRFCEDEWTAAFHLKKLQPIRIRDCPVSGLLAPLRYVDLANLIEDKALKALISGLRIGPPVDEESRFPGPSVSQPPKALTVRFPGHPAPHLEPDPPPQPQLHRPGGASGRPPGGPEFRGAGGADPGHPRLWAGWGKPPWRWSMSTATSPITTWCGGCGLRSSPPWRRTMPRWPGPSGCRKRTPRTRRPRSGRCAAGWGNWTGGSWSSTTPGGRRRYRNFCPRGAAATCSSPPGTRSGGGWPGPWRWRCCPGRRPRPFSSSAPARGMRRRRSPGRGPGGPPPGPGAGRGLYGGNGHPAARLPHPVPHPPG